MLDLDNTLVHSVKNRIKSRKEDILVKIDLNSKSSYSIYCYKRPGVDQFLKTLAENFEIIIFTASLGIYANQVMRQLDPNRVCQTILNRTHCTVHEGLYTKDMRLMNRNMKDIIIVDNCPSAYMLTPEVALPIKTWLA